MTGIEWIDYTLWWVGLWFIVSCVVGLAWAMFALNHIPNTSRQEEGGEDSRI